jgi:hypothetical protein
MIPDELNVISEDKSDAGADICPHCGGTGEVPNDEVDSEGHTQRGVGSRPCSCRWDEEDIDDE